jgi:hypothetical protein
LNGGTSLHLVQQACSTTSLNSESDKRIDDKKKILPGASASVFGRPVSFTPGCVMRTHRFDAKRAGVLRLPMAFRARSKLSYVDAKLATETCRFIYFLLHLKHIKLIRLFQVEINAENGARARALSDARARALSDARARALSDATSSNRKRNSKKLEGLYYELKHLQSTYELTKSSLVAGELFHILLNLHLE